MGLLLNIVNAPIDKLIDLIKALLFESPDISNLYGVWQAITYVISVTYGLLFLYAGYQFLVSGVYPEKREKAKQTLKNILIMIILVQTSFYLYQILLKLGSALTEFAFNLIDPNYFLLTAESSILGVFLYVFYLIALILSIIIIAIRYFILYLSAILFPIGIYCSFIDMLTSFGKFIMSFILVNVFSGFFIALIFLLSSMLIQNLGLESLKIFLLIATFLVADIVVIFFMLFALVKGALNIVSTAKPLLDLLK